MQPSPEHKAVRFIREVWSYYQKGTLTQEWLLEKESEFERATEADSDPRNNILLGVVRSHLGHFWEAKKAFDKAEEDSYGKDTFVLGNIASFYQFYGLHCQALSYAKATYDEGRGDWFLIYRILKNAFLSFDLETWNYFIDKWPEMATCDNEDLDEPYWISDREIQACKDKVEDIKGLFGRSASDWRRAREAVKCLERIVLDSGSSIADCKILMSGESLFYIILVYDDLSFVSNLNAKLHKYIEDKAGYIFEEGVLSVSVESFDEFENKKIVPKEEESEEQEEVGGSRVEEQITPELEYEMSYKFTKPPSVLYTLLAGFATSAIGLVVLLFSLLIEGQGVVLSGVVLMAFGFLFLSAGFSESENFEKE